MTRNLYLAAPSWTGTWHRFRIIDHARAFADKTACRFHFLWAVSGGVSHCRFEELLAPIPGVQTHNISEPEMDQLEENSKNKTTVEFRGRKLDVYRKGKRFASELLTFDFEGARALEAASVAFSPKTSHCSPAIPAPELARRASEYMRKYRIDRRVGIRVRVTECAEDGRKPTRNQRELDDTVRQIIRLPWHLPTFLVTDSEYIQSMLASHFHDCKFLPKQFTETTKGRRYVSRYDRESMRTFMAEVVCLSSCRKIVNVGGFLNEAFVREKTYGLSSDLTRLVGVR